MLKVPILPFIRKLMQGNQKRDQSGKYIDPEDTDFTWNITDLADLELGTYSTSNLGTST